MSGYVYLIGSPIFGWYKIGKAKTPEVRVRDLGILLPFKIEVIAVWKAENHHLLEKTLHEMYAENRINGEWFEFTKKRIAQEIMRCIPDIARVYPSDRELAERMDRFSNLFEDTKSSKKIIGLRVQKLRGNFTLEERETRRVASMEIQKQEKLEKEKQLVLDL